MNYFQELKNYKLLIDVRSPAEFAHAHIPNAVNVPLFSNEERAEVGTAYKRTGRDSAVKKGLSLIGERFGDIYQEIIKTTKDSREDTAIYCARGGMRSEAICFLMGLSGIRPNRIKGGYKRFRNEVLKIIKQDWNIKVLGGYTGSGKTEVLKKLKEQGHYVLDLEGLANHRGSSYGAIPDKPQPSSEFFENMLSLELSEFFNSGILNAKDFDSSKPIWVEDESRLIGKVIIPDPFFKKMREAEVVFLNVPFETRAKDLLELYGNLPKEYLIESTRKIEKRLGGAQTKEAISAIEAGDLYKAVEISLRYYDKAYDYGILKREKSKITRIEYDKNAMRSWCL